MKNVITFLLFTLLNLGSKVQRNNSVNSGKDGGFVFDRQIDKYLSFPGGEKAWGKFFSNHLQWPKSDAGDTQGKVIISFIVERDGRLSDFKIERSLGKDFDAEVLRVMKLSPKWIPAKQNGKTIRKKYTVPINFVIGE